MKTLAKTEENNGETITTTIDIRLQDKIYKQLDGDNGLSKLQLIQKQVKF